MGASLSPEKGWSHDTRYHVDGPWEHGAQWETQTQKDAQGVTPLTGNVQSRPIRRHSGSLLSGAGSTEWRVIANGDRMSFGGRRMFWNVNTLVNFTIRELCIIKLNTHCTCIQWTYFIPLCPLLYTCCCLVTKSCLTLCDTLDCNPPGVSVHGISQARILEWIARNQTGISCIDRRILYRWATREAYIDIMPHFKNVK